MRRRIGGSGHRPPALALRLASLALAEPPRTRHLLGVDFCEIDYEGALRRIEAMVARRERGYVCHVSVNALMNANREPAAMSALREADLVLPDGMPVVWALRSLGAELRDRVYGPELMSRAFERSIRSGTRHFLYGGRDRDATATLAAALRRR